jgi:hypothetical protein
MNAPELPNTVKILATLWFMCLGPFAKPLMDLGLSILEK